MRLSSGFDRLEGDCGRFLGLFLVGGRRNGPKPGVLRGWNRQILRSCASFDKESVFWGVGGNPEIP